MGYLYTKKYQGGGKDDYSAEMYEDFYGKYPTAQELDAYNSRQEDVIAPMKRIEYDPTITTPNVDLSIYEQIPEGREYKSGRSGDFKSFLGSERGEVALGALAKTGLNVGNVIMNKMKIERAAKLAKQRIVPEVLAETKTVAPVTDIPQEVLALRKKQIDNLKSTYRGSDAVLTAISDAMVQAQKSQLKEQLGAERAIHLTGERRRVAEQEGANQVASIRARNINEAQRAAEDARIRGVDVQKQEALRDLYSKAANQAVATIDSAASYNTARELKERNTALDAIDRELDLYASQLSSGTLDVDRQGKVQNEYDRLLNQRRKLIAQSIPTYNQLIGKAITFKRGGKLIPRT